jgi:HK97 gp10 family phage protein
MADFNHIPQVIDKLKEIAPQIVKKGAFDVEAQAKSNAAVATGFMRSAIYTETDEGSTYGQGVSGEGNLEPELLGDTEHGMTAWVVAGADYSVYVELGTVHMAAQPFLAPAADTVAPSFQAAWDKLQEALSV